MKELFSKEKWKYVFYTVSHPADGYYWNPGASAVCCSCRFFSLSYPVCDHAELDDFGTAV